jgi:hypothetical protein
VVLAAALCCTPVGQQPAGPVDIAPEATQASAAGTETSVAAAVGLDWTPTQVGRPWFPMPFCQVASWNPYGADGRASWAAAGGAAAGSAPRGSTAGVPVTA